MRRGTSAALNSSVLPKPCIGDSPSMATLLPHKSCTTRSASEVEDALVVAELAPRAGDARAHIPIKATNAAASKRVRNVMLLKLTQSRGEGKCFAGGFHHGDTEA